jgi:hypothetical protein
VSGTTAPVVADSKQTLLCTYLSAVLPAGLVLNATLGWSWADPLVGLVIAAVAVKEALRRCLLHPQACRDGAGVIRTSIPADLAPLLAAS